MAENIKNNEGLRKEKDVREKQEATREKIEQIKDAVAKHNKIIFPAVLAVAFLITVVIGVSANGKREEQSEVEANAAAEVAQITTEETAIPVPDVPLEENAYPEINELVAKYYQAMASGDTEILSELVSPLTDSYLIRFTELAKHVEACPTVNVYTKPGPVEDSFIAYVCTEIQVAGCGEETIPGFMSFYICKNDAGNYYINIEEEIDQKIADYIKAVDFQDDVVDLNNKVSVQFNNLLAENEAVSDSYVNVTQSITKGIQETMQAKVEEENQEQPEEQEAAEPVQPAVATAKVVRATDVVNKRSSDSEIADKLGKAEIGDTFTVLEERANGWTKVTDGTGQFFIKSDYLETVSEEPVSTAETGTGEEGAAEEAPAPEEETPAVNLSLGSSGYVTATTTVNVRRSANESGEKLGVVYQGEKLELIMNQADGWCKVKYNGETAYVKSEFLE